MQMRTCALLLMNDFDGIGIEPSGFGFGLRFSRHTPIARQGKDARKTRAGVVCFLCAFKRTF